MCFWLLSVPSQVFPCILYLLWFNFILGLNFLLSSFRLIIIHNSDKPKRRKTKFKPRIKLSCGIAIHSQRAILREESRLNFTFKYFCLKSSIVEVDWDTKFQR